MKLEEQVEALQEEAQQKEAAAPAKEDSKQEE